MKMNDNIVIEGHIVDVIRQSVVDAKLVMKDGKIEQIIPVDNLSSDAPYIMPGFIDAHVHIESSMLLPSAFARAAVKSGTVGVVADPHEIANVLGIEGVNYMIEEGRYVPFHFCFGASPCVPATTFETSGAELTEKDVRGLLARHDIYFLSEMMNFPGVLSQGKKEMAMLAAAKEFGKPVDGHAPGLSQEDIDRYIDAGISTEHECFNIESAMAWIRHGANVLIREGSAAQNFEALIPLMKDYSKQLMFCSDDKHPDELIRGHINLLVKRAIHEGYPLWNVLRAACCNPVDHYRMEIGLLQPGDSADFILVNNLHDFDVKATYIRGIQAYDSVNGWDKAFDNKQADDSSYPNKFCALPLTVNDIQVPFAGHKMKVIVTLRDELYTKCEELTPAFETKNGVRMAVSDTKRDILKLVVYNRYQQAKPQVAFIKGFGLQKGALASSIAHDSHNLIAVGVDDESIVSAIDQLIEVKGGIAVADGKNTDVMPLPIAGLMSPEPVEWAAETYHRLNNVQAQVLGSPLKAPFMTLSFMALLVIPELKLSDCGLFDGKKFAFTSLDADDE